MQITHRIQFPKEPQQVELRVRRTIYLAMRNLKPTDKDVGHGKEQCWSNFDKDVVRGNSVVVKTAVLFQEGRKLHVESLGSVFEASNGNWMLGIGNRPKSLQRFRPASSSVCCGRIQAGLFMRFVWISIGVFQLWVWSPTKELVLMASMHCIYELYCIEAFMYVWSHDFSLIEYSGELDYFLKWFLTASK